MRGGAVNEPELLFCPHCSAELARFQEPVATFRVAFQDWSDRENAPQLQEVTTFLLKPGRFFIPTWSWAALGMAVVLLTAVPIYLQQEELKKMQDGGKDSLSKALVALKELMKNAIRDGLREAITGGSNNREAQMTQQITLKTGRAVIGGEGPLAFFK